LSDGQKVILQLCVALHAQKSELENSIFLLDEPENHLHPSAAIDLLKMLYESTGNSQIWIATHSIPLLAYVASEEPMSLWYVDGGAVSSAGRHPEIVLESLLGNEDRLGQLNAFTSLPAQLAVVNYAMESLLPPTILGGGADDPQVLKYKN
jgi:energy-coupling factor transporter ATP-binding protein EcfA2